MSARVPAARVRGGAARRPAASAPALPQALLTGAITLAMGGFGVAAYLAVTHLGDQPIACNGLGDCNYVNSSEYAKVAGVPVSLLGAGAYAVIAALTLMAWRARSFELLLAAWGMALASFAFSAYLTWIELRVLEAICIYCVASAVIITALFAALTVASSRLRDEW
jgi:uncharacterized membrane protein